MQRDEYFKTIQGQIGLRRCRRRKELHTGPIPLEPRSKHATDKEKLAFQRAILSELTAWKRRYFRSPVALEFDFFPTANDPPAVHTLPKNYLDLLQWPMPTLNSRRKHLVLSDDRNVAYLAAKYHVSANKASPEIWLRVAPYSNLVADAALLYKVANHDLRPASDAFDYTSSSSRELAFDALMDERENSPLDDPSDKLREHERGRAFWIKKFGQSTYDAWQEMYIIDIQNHLLKTLALTPRSLLSLLSPLFFPADEVFDSIHAWSRNMLISSQLSIDLHHSDLKEGGSSIYKLIVKKAMAEFKERFKRLFPWRVQTGVTILYQPPAKGGIDLDNLARRVIPFVNEEIRPPSSHLLTVDVDRVTDTHLKQWYLAKQQALKRMPKYSVTHYQVIRLPRLTNDNRHGFVRLLLEPGDYSTCWGKISDLLKKWEDAVCARY